ncbi:MAG: DNA gyrase inhibitor YacG [Pseudomonadota bacterium]
MSCPVCSRPTDAKYRPFCSRRCADVDLGRWLTGTYVIPTEEADQEDTPDPHPDDDSPRRPS